MLSEEQQVAQDKILDFVNNPTSCNFMVLRGHSGTGKTFTTADTINKIKKAVMVTATTHKAATVLQNQLGNTLTVRTIHSVLKLRVKTNFKTGEQYVTTTNKTKPIDNTVIFIDESSMLPMQLLEICSEYLSGSKVIFIGDPFQLAPVKYTTAPVFSQELEEAVLTTVRRQALENPIVALGDELRKTVQYGQFKDIQLSDKVQLLSRKEFHTKQEELYLNQEHVDDNRTLVWRNDSVTEYNRAIRELFFKEDSPQAGESFISNDPVIDTNGEVVLENNADIVIKSSRLDEVEDVMCYRVTTECGNELLMIKDFASFKATLNYFAKNKDWPTYFRLKQGMADLRPNYASTVHKSQGSTYKNVFIDLDDIGLCNKAGDVARMLYVAITRASEQVYLVGELPAKYRG